MTAPFRPGPLSAALFAALLAAATVVLVSDPRPTRRGESAGRPEPENPVPSAVLARSWARAAVIREVGAGRLGVAEAAAVFGWLDRQPPAVPAGMVRVFARHGNEDLLALARSEVDLLCLHVVLYARGDLAVPPARLAEVEGEFRRACASPDRAALPAVVEADCREWLARSAAAERAAQSPRPGGTVTASLEGLRLVAGR